MQNDSIAIGIQARMGSTRLPGKSLEDITGKPLIHWVIERALCSKLVDSVWLLTTNSKRDDPLVKSATEFVNVIRGDEFDVRSRYRQLFDLTGVTHAIRVTGDCPFLDSQLIDSLVEAHIESKTDYYHVASQPEYDPSYPNGFNAEIFSACAFKRMERFGSSPQHKEHVTWSVNQNPRNFRYGRLIPSFELSRPTWKLSVDTANDLNRVRRIALELGKKAIDATVAEIIAVGDEHPEWFE